MKRKKAIDFLTVTLFAGIILTFLLYFGIGMLVDSDISDDKTGFNETFCSDSLIADSVNFIDYKIFRHIAGDNIITGRDGWLFETVDSETGYERLLDYIGGSPFSDKQLKTVADKISARQAEYAKNGVEYMLVVIPDTANACSDKMPRYLGRQSDNTRLAGLSLYTEQNGIRGFVNPTARMKAQEGEVPKYNNTENSINSYGAFCIYNTVISEYTATGAQVTGRIYRDDVEFYTRPAEGKSIAAMAGLEHIIPNKTVSLTDKMPDNYDVTYNERGFMITERLGTQADKSQGVIVECTDSWDRAQLMPYFSNTFDRVYYRDYLTAHPTAGGDYGAYLVVQIIREGQLSDLLVKY